MLHVPYANIFHVFLIVLLAMFFTAIWVLGTIGLVKEIHDSSVREFNNLSPEARMTQIAGILSALLGQSRASKENLKRQTGLKGHLLGYIVQQLWHQGYVDGDNGYLTLTGKGMDLYHQVHTGKKGQYYQMGDIFNVKNSTVVNRSSINNSLNRLDASFDKSSRDAVHKLIDEVLKSGNSDAAENLDGFLAELDEKSPRRSVLNSLLNGIATALPPMAAASELVENVRRIIASI